jgi:heme exporter protein A
MLTLNNLSVWRDGEMLLSELALTLFPTALVQLNGPNGIGKTSLLKTIAKLLPEARGTLMYNQIDINEALDEYYSLISYSSHELQLRPELTVHENLTLWADVYGTTPALNAALHAYELEAKAQIQVANLSAGYKKRVHLARLLLEHGDVWLLDEPLVNLDQTGKELFYNVIKAKLQNHGIVIMASHEELADLEVIKIDLNNYRPKK